MRHPAPDDVDDLVDDLDDDGARSDRGADRRGGGSPVARRLLRSPWALPVAVAVLVLVGGGTGVHQARATAVADLAREHQLSALQLGAATAAFEVSPSDGQPVGDPSLQQVQVSVLNSGDVPASVAVVGTSLQDADLLPGTEAVSLEAGTGGVLALVLRVDCAAFPVDPSATTRPEPTAQWLDLAVDVGGRTTERRYLLPESGWGALGTQLGYACHPNAWGGGVSSVLTPADDGTLHVGLTDVQGEPVRLALQAPPALGVTSDPPLPLDVPAGQTREVRLSMAPDCATLPEGIGDPYALPVQVVTQGDGGGGNVLDATTTAVWVARQLALACG